MARIRVNRWYETLHLLPSTSSPRFGKNQESTSETPPTDMLKGVHLHWRKIHHDTDTVFTCTFCLKTQNRLRSTPFPSSLNLNNIPKTSTPWRIRRFFSTKKSPRPRPLTVRGLFYVPENTFVPEYSRYYGVSPKLLKILWGKHPPPNPKSHMSRVHTAPCVVLRL